MPGTAVLHRLSVDCSSSSIGGRPLCTTYHNADCAASPRFGEAKNGKGSVVYNVVDDYYRTYCRCVFGKLIWVDVGVKE
jgi:hypothetical protein